ncbi:MAG: hypothetical protein ABIR11_13220 [Candidatus Limnocylindrales bacterium]
MLGTPASGSMDGEGDGAGDADGDAPGVADGGAEGPLEAAGGVEITATADDDATGDSLGSCVAPAAATLSGLWFTVLNTPVIARTTAMSATAAMPTPAGVFNAPTAPLPDGGRRDPVDEEPGRDDPALLGRARGSREARVRSPGRFGMMVRRYPEGDCDDMRRTDDASPPFRMDV